MASNINYEDIDGAFPRAGVDNPSQGFRDNFTVIKDSLQTAKEEISVLETVTAKLNSANDFNGNQILQAKLVNCVQETFTRTTPSNSEQIVDYVNGNYQEFRIDKNTNFVLDGWPDSDGYAVLRLAVFSTSSSTHVITFRVSGTGQLAYDQEATFTEVSTDPQTGTQFQTILTGMSSSHVVGDDLKVFEFWTKTAGSLVFARYLGVYDGTPPAALGSSSNLSSTTLQVSGTSTLNGAVTLTGSTLAQNATVLTVNGASALKNVVITGNLTVTGNTALQTSSITVASIDNIGDVDVTSPVTGDLLRYNAATSTWTNAVTAITEIFNVTIDTYDVPGFSTSRKVFYLDNIALQTASGNQKGLFFESGRSYRFTVGDLSNAGLPLKFSTSPDILVGGINATVTDYVTNVTRNRSNTGGQAGDFVQITVTDDTPSPLYLYAAEIGAANTDLYGAAYPISVNSGSVKVVNKRYDSPGNQSIVVDTNVDASIAGPITIRLPANAASGMTVTVVDAGNADVHSIIIDRNGANINGVAANRTLSSKYATITLISSGTGNWAVADPIRNGANIQLATESVSTATGALTVAGGTGISKNLNVGGNLKTAGAVTLSGKFIVDGIQELNDIGNVELDKTAHFFRTSAASTAILVSAGAVEGQIKTFAMRQFAGLMKLTVNDAGWTTSLTGYIVFNSLGSACTLQFLNGKWFVIGHYDCIINSTGNVPSTGKLFDLTDASVDTQEPLNAGQLLYWTGVRWTNGYKNDVDESRPT